LLIFMESWNKNEKLDSQLVIERLQNLDLNPNVVAQCSNLGVKQSTCPIVFFCGIMK